MELQEAIQSKKATLVSNTTERANEEALRLGRSLRNNEAIEEIQIANYVGENGNAELVSDTAHLTDILYFLRHGPRLRQCVLRRLQGSWQPILHAVGANPSVKELHALGLDRSVENLCLEYIETLYFSFHSPQPWITDALYTARNLRVLTIKVMHDDPSCLIRIFEQLTSCPLLYSVSIHSTEAMMKREDGTYDMLHWIAKNCPLLENLCLEYVSIDAGMFSLIRVPHLILRDCVVEGTPRAIIRNLQINGGTTKLVQSQLQTLESFFWDVESWSYKASEALSMVQTVLPQAQVLRSVTIQYLEYDELMALFHTLPQFTALRELTVRNVIEFRRLGALSRALLDGLRGNGSLTSVTLSPRRYGGSNLFPVTSITHRAVKYYLERNRKLPRLLHNHQEVRSPLVPSVLFTALKAPMTGIPLVASFLWRYN